MKIIRLIYLKYFLSLSICLISSCVIFFIFSLLGNLNEDYFFNTIIKLSLLNSLQILMYIPSFIFLISVVLLIIFLRSRNEMIIIKSYISIRMLMLFFLPLAFFFTILELNKNDFVSFFEDSKNNLIKLNDKNIPRIIINEENGFKDFIVLNNFDQKNIEEAELRYYKIFNKKIQIAQFSNNLKILNNNLIANNYSQYKENSIKDYKNERVINIDLQNLFKKSSNIQKLSNKNNYVINFKFVNEFIFFILFLSYVFLIFSNKKYVSIKESLSNPIFICLFFIIYSFLVFNNSLTIYKNEFEILASLIIGILVLKESLYE